MVNTATAKAAPSEDKGEDSDDAKDEMGASHANPDCSELLAYSCFARKQKIYAGIMNARSRRRGASPQR